MNGVSRILHLQTGGGLSGGISSYISSLVCSPVLSDFYFFVASGLRESAELSQSQKYGNAKIIEIPFTYGFGSFLKVLRDVHRLLQYNNITLVHSHALRAGFICAVLNLLFGTRFVHTNHGLRFQQKPTRISFFVFLKLELFVLSRAECVFCIRDIDRNLLCRKLPDYSHKIKTIVTRIDPIPMKCLEKASIDQRFPVFIGIGSIIDVKRVDRFIDWLGALTIAGFNYSAIWLGDGPLRPEMEVRAKNQLAKVKWLGHVDTNTVADELSKADVMLLTSDFEVLPLAALEAMSYSLPIISTNFFGVQEFIKDGVTGLVLSSNMAPNVAAEKIVNLLKNWDLYYLMRENGKAFFGENFSGVETMASSYARQYQLILTNAHRTCGI